MQHVVFLSTLSLRRATIAHFDYDIVAPDFYPRSPCGERRAGCSHVAGRHQDFYPRSPCGERLDEYNAQQGTQLFLSTLSLRRATEVPEDQYTALSISIHALLAESDAVIPQTSLVVIDFYPRSPCGERPNTAANEAATKAFLSTLSLRRATIACPVPCRGRAISIHALLAESDRQTHSCSRLSQQFLSTLSLRRATSRAPPTVDPLAHFYPRSPCGERLAQRRANV